MVGLWTPGSSLPPVVNEDTLIYFVAHCTQMLHLTYKTIKLYLAGIRHSYLQLDVSTPLSNISSLLRVQNILKGVRKVQGDSRQKRLPITYDILCNIWQCLEHYGLSEYTKLLLQTACALAFYGFLRCGEFTICGTQFSTATNLCMSDIIFHMDKRLFVLHLKASKTDVFRRGVNVSINAMNRDVLVCPYRVMKNFHHIRTLAGARACDPLFLMDNGRALSRTFFITTVKAVLSRLGYDSQCYNGHSFRMGAATSAAKAGIPDHLIQTLGRWSSNTYCRYINVHPDRISFAQRQMSQRDINN
ncbi:hypothetical protein ACJMK2_036686 [Sinanodonta woodiana]|uniref:Tyr recombinase domain-containing protein n=1 Tax=Sinanodonta woodiana TaxID=1069815 RepID=A0ABD3WHZ3_SINWO